MFNFEPDKILKRFFIIYGLILPITSFLVIPSIQGTTPGFLLSFLGLGILFFLIKEKKVIILNDLFVLIGLFVFVTFFGQLFLSFSSNLSFENLKLVDPNNKSLLLKKTLFTQSLYLFAGFSAFILIKNFFQKDFEDYFFRGAIFLSLYGLYEWVYFLFFHSNGDFISNRNFESTSGSLFQVLSLGGSLNIERVKSLTGEPSMFAFTILPFWAYGMKTGRKFTSYLFLLVLILSTSTTAFLGFIIYCVFEYRTLYQKVKSFLKHRRLISSLLFITALFIIFVLKKPMQNIFKSMIWDKLTMRNQSGSDRSMFMLNHLNFFKDLPFFNKLFGVGFGYVRSTDFFSTLLVNSGLIGLCLFTLLFLHPIIKLGKTNEEKGLKIALAMIFITMMISVPEFSYLPIWLFLGISYNILHHNKPIVKIKALNR